MESMPLHEPDPKRQRLSLNHGLVLHSITADAQEGGFAEIPYAERALSRRGNKIPTPFFLEGSRQLKLKRASLLIYGLE